MNFKVVSLGAAVFAVSALLSQTAAAVPVFFTDRATFQAAAGTLVTESLDSVTTGGNVTVQPTGVTLTAGGGANNFSQENGAAFISEGTSSLGVGNWNAGATMTFGFNGPIVAFGVDFLDNTAPFDMDFTVNGVTENFSSNVSQITVPNGPLFFGVIDVATFTQAVIETNNNNLDVDFDFIQFGTTLSTAVPEPGSLSLFAAGLGFLAWRRRKLAQTHL